MALTEKQKKFVDEYIVTLNATEAARRAGYSNPHVQGPRLLANVRVRNFIDERLKKIEDARIAKADELMRYLTAVVRKEAEKDAPAKIRLMAAEMLLKRYDAASSAESTGELPVIIRGEEEIRE